MRVLSADTRTYDDEHWEGDPDDHWGRPNTYTDFVGIDITHKDKAYYDEVVADWDGPAYVVVVRYSTGDTFGSDHGRIKLLAAFPERETAEEFIKVAKNETGNKNTQVRMDFEFMFRGEKYFRDWVGYFESLDDIFIEKVGR